ncbi:MAG: secretin and TonB N-terminal domain-containing protein [Candidatus Omnitrophica bacterium]|nr:secretin and TonB N-terminal domain-containing protein [Candidatus Omnitrophota bacterium]
MKIKFYIVLASLVFLMTEPTGYTQELTGIGPPPDEAIAGDAGQIISMEERKVSLDFENAELKDILKAFSRQTGANFIASEVIEGKKVTVYLSNVSVDEALSSILKSNGLVYEKQKGDVFLIKPSGTEAIKTVIKVIKLDYIQAYSLVMPAEAVGFASTGGAFPITEVGGSPEGGGLASSAASGMPQGTEGKSIIDIVSSLLTKYGKVIADKKTNSLIITEIPENIKIIEDIIKELDVEPPQIMIQAEIVETTTSALKRIGMEYGSLTETLGFKYGLVTGSDETQRLQTPVGFPFPEWFIKQTFDSQLLSNAALFNYGTLTANDTEVILKLISNDEDTKYLSRPKIMTVNNQPAIIKVSANTAIGVESTTIGEGDQVLSKAERVETGIVLKVTPQANAKGQIFMYLEPSVSRAQTSTFFSTQFLDPQVRSASSTVLVQDGDTVVIGGLIKTDNYKTIRKVPFLGDIPFFGEAFKSSYKKVDDTELLIFVTPHIVKKRGDQYIMPPEVAERDRAIRDTLERYGR